MPFENRNPHPRGKRWYTKVATSLRTMVYSFFRNEKAVLTNRISTPQVYFSHLKHEICVD